MMDRFYVGLHQPCDAHRFARCCISVNRLRERRSDLKIGTWIMDSGAFTEISRYGGYRETPEAYANQVERWARCGDMEAAVSQDYMCEPFILSKTGLSIADHQRLTIERYDALRALVRNAYVMPVLQGYAPADYATHIAAYGERLIPGMWVGVGSVCKRNSDVGAIEAVLIVIRDARPDLRLHGFGVKLTALESSVVRDCLWSADSMAWSYHARKNGGDANSWRSAARFVRQVEGQQVRRRHFQYSWI